MLTDTDTRPFDVRRDEDRAKVRKALLAGVGPYANTPLAERTKLLKMLMLSRQPRPPPASQPSKLPQRQQKMQKKQRKLDRRRRRLLRSRLQQKKPNS